MSLRYPHFPPGDPLGMEKKGGGAAPVGIGRNGDVIRYVRARFGGVLPGGGNVAGRRGRSGMWNEPPEIFRDAGGSSRQGAADVGGTVRGCFPCVKLAWVQTTRWEWKVGTLGKDGKEKGAAARRTFRRPLEQ